MEYQYPICTHYRSISHFHLTDPISSSLYIPNEAIPILSRFLSTRKQLAITAFAEALHSCFKDGLNGTHDYRAFAGATFCITLLISTIKFFPKEVSSNGTLQIVEVVLRMILTCIIS